MFWENTKEGGCVHLVFTKLLMHWNMISYDINHIWAALQFMPQIYKFM